MQKAYCQNHSTEMKDVCHLLELNALLNSHIFSNAFQVIFSTKFLVKYNL